jgi:predicted RNase H-like nuclease
MPLRIGGADGCRQGWTVATDRGVIAVSSLQDSAFALDILGVDMPIGLPDSWRRRADDAARAFLPPSRRSSVFPTLPRSLLGERSYAAANAASKARYGRGVSIQSWSLAPTMRELDTLARTPGVPTLLEIHPECSFWAMTGELLPPKRTRPGVDARRRAIETWYEGDVPDRLPGAAADDILDAVAVLWSARRFVAGEHVVLGDGSTDRHGLPMRIVV